MPHRIVRYVMHGALLILACLAPMSLDRAAAAEPAVVKSTSPDSLPRLGTFREDITPPLGSPLCAGSVKPLVGVDDPLWAKGIVLDDGQHRYVLCALDWCEVRNLSHDQMRTKLAAAAGTEPRYVAVQCLHQHNAPIVDSAAQHLLDAHPNPPALCDVPWFDSMLDRLAARVREATVRLEPFDAISTGTAKVERIASSRRLAKPGEAMRVRFSSTTDKSLQEWPEGLIDPLLRTVTFSRGEKPLVRLHYYASHPQTYYGDGRACTDFPGMARERLEREDRAFQVYFTGCGGNVAAGKYNDGTPLARVQLADRMYQAMQASIAASRPQPLAPRWQWRTAELRMKPRNDGGNYPEQNRATVENGEADARARLGAALSLAYRQRAEQPIEVSSLEIGNVWLVHLPGEPFVEYQLDAQKLRPDDFVCVAGYGDGGPGYLCLERSYAEGGYEPTASLVVPESEKEMRRAISQLLGIE
ncbi:MAG: hypothetical protein KF708_03960 [Pirellulales bacterium]|nr:hypothetical protein [Pirellulales bacterium]